MNDAGWTQEFDTILETKYKKCDDAIKYKDVVLGTYQGQAFLEDEMAEQELLDKSN